MSKHLRYQIKKKKKIREILENKLLFRIFRENHLLNIDESNLAANLFCEIFLLTKLHLHNCEDTNR